jgi:hypothetical protein
MAIALAVIVTGNHFVMDIVAGVVVTILGYAIGKAVARWRLGDRSAAVPAAALATSG